MKRSTKRTFRLVPYLLGIIICSVVLGRGIKGISLELFATTKMFLWLVTYVVCSILGGFLFVWFGANIDGGCLLLLAAVVLVVLGWYASYVIGISWGILLSPISSCCTSILLNKDV